MSEENVEIVRRHVLAYLRGDNDAALAAYDPEVEFDASLRPDGLIYKGREGIAEGMRVWVGAWEDYRVEIKEFIDAGDKVLFAYRESGQGRGSGVEIDQEAFGVFTLRDGKIIHWKNFLDRDEALEAAGLSE